VFEGADALPGAGGLAVTRSGALRFASRQNRQRGTTQRLKIGRLSVGTTNKSLRRQLCKFGAPLILALLAAGGCTHSGGGVTEDGEEKPEAGVHVEVVKPQPGGMDRVTTQPGSIQAFETVPLYAAVSGYLKRLYVDIGSKVKKDDVLAVIEVPELLKQLQRNRAGVEQAAAKVEQMKAEKTVAESQLNAAKAKVNQSIAADKAAKAWVDYREKQLRRQEYLFSRQAVEEKLVDEAKDHYETAVESKNAAEETIAASKANELAAAARIVQASANIDAALAEVKVAQAEAEKTEEMVKYATILAPFDGVISKRTVNERDLIRAATAGPATPPLLTVDRTDKFRVIVEIPDKDVPYADVGDEASIEIDSLPDQLFKASIARVADAEDPQTRMMRVEIDLLNTSGKLRHGMYGRATIVLEKAVNVFALPPTCVISRTDKGKGQVYVVRNNRAVLTPVTVVGENEVAIGVRGLNPNDQVIVNPQPGLVNGTPVTFTPPTTKKGRR
jgi:RND family efflux transporter MFP subunit